MEKETVPSWAAEPPAAATVPSWAVAPQTSRTEANRAQASASSNTVDALAILQQEFAAAQQRLTAALASGDTDDINRKRDDMAGLSREIIKLKGTPPAVSSGAPTEAQNEKPLLSGADVPLPLQALASGATGAVLAGSAATPVYGTYRGGKAALEFVGSLLDKSRAGKSADVLSRVDPTLSGGDSGAKGSPKGGAAGWLAGRTGDLAAVPDALASEVSTLKGQGPGSASYAEAQNAANIQRQIAAGEPLTAWRPEPGGRILTTPPSGGGSARTFTAPSIQQQARGSTQLTPQIGGKPAPVAPAPVAAAPVIAPEAIPSSFKQAVAYAKAVARNPIAKAMTVGGSLGAAIPYAAADWMKGDYQGAMKKMGIGAGIGAALVAAPAVGKVLPPLAAVAQGYDVGQRTQAKDYTGAALSAAGGLGALATMAPKLVPPAASMGVALGAPLVNLSRDWIKEHPGEIQRWMAEQGRPQNFDEMGNAY